MAEKDGDLDHWNTILDQEGLGVIGGEQDCIERYIKETVKRTIEGVDFSLSVQELITQIESIKNCKVVIDYNELSIAFLGFDGNCICDMAPGVVRGESFPDNYNKDHFYMEVNEDYQRQGFGSIIFKLYEKLASLSDNDFFMSGLEYKKKPKPILFFLSNGYELKSIITPDGDERELLDYEVEEIINEFKDPNILPGYAGQNIYRLEKEQ